MERSPHSSQAQVPTNVVSFERSETDCIVCNEKMCEGQECLLISECNHSFHRSCIETYLSSSSECPNCKRACTLSELKRIDFPAHSQHIDQAKSNKRGRLRGAANTHVKHFTRSQARNLFPDPNTTLQEANLLTPPRIPLNSELHNQRNDCNNMQQNIDYTHINYMIENTVSRLLQNLNIQVPSNSASQVQNSQQPLRPQNSNPTCENSRSNSRYSSSFDESFAIRSDKITSIIQNWNIKFDGSCNGISVDEFLYRVRCLTRENFNNDFSLICKNLHVLLAGKARDWYWRYHKQVDTIEWKEFCAALKYQYKEFKSRFDIQEEIRNRKMKPNETFESFYESISAMLDKLETPMPESDLVEILTRNLRPEIRHELLYIPIYSIAHLRKLVQMREHLLSDDYVHKNIAPKSYPNTYVRRQVFEVDASLNLDINESEKVPDISVDAVQQTTLELKCWNCDKLGHYWEDCLEARNIFCYGCGAKNTYKPQCVKCSARKLNHSKNGMAQNFCRNRP